MTIVEAKQGYIIRLADMSDLDQVIHINEVSLPEHYPRWFWENHLRNWGAAFYVAEVEGRVVGYVMPRVEYGFGVIVHGLIRRGHIISIAVLPEYRRRGIGTALMKAAMHALKEVYKCREVYLEVRVSNTPAIRMYEKLGFKKIQVIPFYYLDGEDAYLMAREL
ncbi:MAG: ribosomal protein S18-alanine N-acetyltransferase [Pyrodictiaceae archaeon]